METAPLVSIVVPAFNDADLIASALDSCLRQTLSEIEIIVVDDASEDDTAEVAERYAQSDSRIVVIRQEENRSAFQARRAGILAARAEYILFLDGDDELADDAAERALAKATATGVDLVQFGVDVVGRDGRTGGKFEAGLQPRNGPLSGSDVLRQLFPVGKPAQGTLWRYLFRTKLLVEAYELVPEGLVLPRANDLPIAFLAAAIATSYDSIPDRLYRYNFGLGRSGQKVRDLEWVKFYSSAIQSIDSIEPAVRELSSKGDDSDLILSAYASARMSIIGYTTYYLAEHTGEDLKRAAFEHLYTCASPYEIVQATASFRPEAVLTLARYADLIALDRRPVTRILLTTNIVDGGHASSALLSQARWLLSAGFQVTIAARRRVVDKWIVPGGADFAEITGRSLADQLAERVLLCRTQGVDLVIDRQWSQSKHAPAFALAARVAGVPSIGWTDGFALRSLLLGRNDLEHQREYVHALEHLIVPSRLDVAYWKLRGMPRVSYLPVPPSPLLRELEATGRAKTPPTGRALELMWCGRLERPKNRVPGVLAIASELERRGVDFRIRVLDPDGGAVSAEKLKVFTRGSAVGARIGVTGSVAGESLIAAIDSCDVFLCTDIADGYPGPMIAAQARGLPVVMYRSPWLALAEGNGGVVSAAHDDVTGIAARIAEVAADPVLYATLSSGSREIAKRELSYDFTVLYRQMATSSLPGEFSPAPTVDDARELIDLSILFTEHLSASRRRTAQKGGTVRKAHGPGSAVSAKNQGPPPAARFVTGVTPAARAVLRVAPWLRGPARRVKHFLLRR
ncbi:glycosyltransferase [Microbacterium resistens]|uniref:glycosyltransferase n=1 Tax=Microbacterium resistens TaxID=156977 RepID=UPI003672C257